MIYHQCESNLFNYWKVSMFQHGRNLGKSLPMSDTHFVLSEEEKKQFASYPKSDFFGEAKDQATDPTEHERDTQNDGGYNERTCFKNPPGREKNYLHTRSRAGRRR